MRFALPLIAAGLMAGCSLFGSGDAPKPAALESGIGAANAKIVWKAQIDAPSFPIQAAARGEQFVVAGNDGVVQGLSAKTGAVQWRVDVGRKLSAGVGSDGRTAAVVTRDNELVAITGGKVAWKKPLGTIVIAAPFVAGERVFVVSVDRTVFAFDAIDGSKLFEMKRPGDALTLSKAGVIGAYQDTLVVGQGQRLAGLDPLKGLVRWEASLANPRGTNEVERLADLVGPAFRQGTTICARAFQSAVGCANADRGAPLWMRNTSGAEAIGGDAEQVYAADASDRLSAYKLANGDTAWLAEQFLNRKLSAPLGFAGAVMVGDFEGYLHFLDPKSGKTVARVQTDGSAIAQVPVQLDGTALVITAKGGIYAVRKD
ncbi:MAG: outer membrane protein assembly factor BamB [Paucibacter sp.]|nr:outer membrane protein assembly factor BamB [Roseateles sp.]